MGASSSKIDEDKALKLCRERKKFIRQALDGRCSLLTAHIAYVQSLRNTGTALRKFVEHDGPIESSLYTSTNATPEPVVLTEKSLSQFSLSSPTFLQQVDATENPFPSPSPPNSSQFQASHMKFSSISSKKVEEKLPSPIVGTVTSSSTPQNSKPHYTEKQEVSLFKESAIPPRTPPWDYFGPHHPIDLQFSFQEGKGMNQGFENVDDLRKLREEEGIHELEDEEVNASLSEREESLDSEDEFDEPSADTLVRHFENFNRLHDHNAPSASPTMPFAGSIASERELMNGEKSNSPDLSPVRATSSRTVLPSNTKNTLVKEDCIENKVTSKDFLSSMKDIEHLFIKASESGKEVPRMLEANKLHFRPIFPAKESGSVVSTFFKACFSCGEEYSEVQEEPAQNSVKYLTWHRTESSRSSSSRTPLHSNSGNKVEDLTCSVFDSIHMISSSHASTLDRLYAWEGKLYDEVKAGEMVRRVYDAKRKMLREQESNGESTTRIDKTRAVVKDLHSRIRVAINRIESISKRIEELRDTELQPQLEELIEGLSRMWEVMYECHSLQFHIISLAYNNGDSKIYIQSDSHRQITTHLESELNSLSLSFTRWIDAQKSYLQAIRDWLYKCVYLPQKYSRRKKLVAAPPLHMVGPPIYATCDGWLEKLNELRPERVSDSIKNLVAETICFLPHQEKNKGKSATLPSTSGNADNDSDPAINIMTDEASEEWISGFDRFRSSLVGFIGQLNNFAKDSVVKYTELMQAIKDAKNNYTEMIYRDSKSNADQVHNNGQLAS